MNKCAIIVPLICLVLLAGCSGVLPGGDGNVTPTSTDTTSAPTPTQTATPSPTTTPSPTPTPAPKVVAHKQFASEINRHIDRTVPDDKSVVVAYNGSASVSAILLERPSDWAFKRTEMEGVRAAVRGIKLWTKPNVDSASSSEYFHRPDEVRVFVQNQNGTLVSRIDLDTDLALQYANRDISIEKFASRLDEVRQAREDVSLGENSTLYYLRKSEWRLLKNEQLWIINRSELAGTDGETLDVDTAKIRPKKGEIYYEYSPKNTDQSVAREYMFFRTYWEGVRNVSRNRLVHRYPRRMRVYAEVPGGRDLESSIRTQYAFDFLMITGGSISDENILTNGAWDVYYNKINRTRYPDH